MRLKRPAGAGRLIAVFLLGGTYRVGVWQILCDQLVIALASPVETSCMFELVDRALVVEDDVVSAGGSASHASGNVVPVERMPDFPRDDIVSA